ncbi:MAG TPA: Fe-S protein assembly co-chaperone HscB [Gammaproteobacteria bacterium]|nr:Fe-S protein assembly co-chaperone HscB [Gammaproteobacteria bacterium]HAT26298.1 Fe-S protein assembly co-chaperone HscB [Gammaproteobacteria bacterium]HIA59548.1 Fe-S protein assembly co-chaperone HscB [Gammaproteobacteria bacterium]
MQQIKQNYFQLFKLSESFELDVSTLAENYRQLQLAAHPDRFAAASETEKMRAVQHSSYLNEAYDTLKSTLRRAAYLLSLHDVDVEQVKQSDLGMDLLLEQIQLREALDELPKDSSALPALENLKAEVTVKLANMERFFADELQRREFDSAKKCFHEMQFIHKLLAEIDSSEEQRLGY